MSVDKSKIFEISEKNIRIINPISEDQLHDLAEICEISAGTEVLDIACGKGEQLCQWAREYDAVGTGVDVNEDVLREARERAAEFGVTDQLTFEEEDAREYPIEDHDADIVSCLGGSWIGDGPIGTLDLMSRGTKDKSGLLLLGEPYWTQEPTEDAVELLKDADKDRYATLEEMDERFQDGGYKLVGMIRATERTNDQYHSKRWKAIDDWILDNPDDPDTDQVQSWAEEMRQTYLEYERKFFGWGVFVLRKVKE